jgi:phosphatidylglycerophosphate synthase
MSKVPVFSIFSEEEEKGYMRWRVLRDRALGPMAVWLAGHGVSATMISAAGLLTVLPFIWFFGFNPWLAFIFIILNVFLDALDGPVARAKGGSVARQGAVIDFACDHLGFFIIFMTFFYYGLMNPFWGSLYLVNYVVMLAMVLFCNALKIRFFPVIRSKYMIYLIFFVWLMTGYNHFDAVLVFFTFYMAITNYFLFTRIRCQLR